MEKLKEMFKEANYKVSNQALSILLNMNDPHEHARIIIQQLNARNLVVAGGDIIKYLITGKISEGIKNSEDLGGIK